MGGYGPLHGVRIFEASSATAPLHVRLAISMAGKIANELGADVAVLEPSVGDSVRQLPPFIKGSSWRSASFEFLNAGKKILSLSNGFDWREIESCGDAVLCDESIPVERITRVVVSTFGPRYPDLNEPASELTLMAMSGVLHKIGEQVGTPVRLPGHQPSYAAGLAAFLAMAAAVFGGAPKTADVSILDALLWINWKIIFEPMGKRTEIRQAEREWQAVPAADGHIALVYMDRDWPAMVDLIDDDRLREPRFATRPVRLENLDALMGVLRPWFATRRREDIYREAKARSIPLGPVWTISDLLRDAQYLERDFLASTPIGVMPRLPVMWNGKRLQPAKGY